MWKYIFHEKDDIPSNFPISTYIFCPSIVQHYLLVRNKDQWIETSVSKELHSAEGESYIWKKSYHLAMPFGLK